MNDEQCLAIVTAILMAGDRIAYENNASPDVKVYVKRAGIIVDEISRRVSGVREDNDP